MELFSKYMYRKSLLDIKEIKEIAKKENYSDYEYLLKLIKYIKDNDLELEIYLASEQLYISMINIKENDSKKKIRNITMSLYKYLSRMIFRTTPFGAFSGVGIKDTNNTKEIKGKVLNNKLYFNISNEFIYYLINVIYEDFENIKNFCVKINKNTYIDKTHIFIPFQVTYKNDEDTKDNNNISLRKNELLTKISNFCRKEIILKDLIDNIKEEYQVDEEIIKRFLLNLIREDYLVTDLDIIHSSNLNLSEDILIKLKEKSKDHNIYIEILEKLIQFRNNLNLIKYDNKNQILNVLIECSKYINESLPGFKGDIFKVDFKYGNFPNEISNSDIENIKDIFNIFSNISLFNNKKILEDYKYRFSEIYGQDEGIPILELLNPNLGLGIPDEYIQNKNLESNSIEEKSRNIHKLINKWKMEAIINQKDVEIDEQKINMIQKYCSTEVSTSFDLYFNKVINGVDNNMYYLNPNTGSIEACQTYGRFAYMFDGTLKDSIQGFRFQDDKNYEYVEISYNHPQGKVQNIMNTFEESKVNLVGESIYDLSDLYIYLGEDFNFYIVSNSSKKILIPRFSNMHNTDISPIIIRFFNDIRNQFNTGWSSIRSYHSEESYNPGVRYKNIVISPRTWNYELPSRKEEKFEEFITNFLDYSYKMKVPNKFYLLENDGRVYIDIKDEIGLQILYKEYLRNKKLEIIAIEEELLNTSSAIIVEYVFSGKIKNIELVGKQKTPSLVNKVTKEIIQPGGKWHSFNLYYNYYNLDKLLEILNYRFFNNFDQNIEIIYFIRYEDPKSHIRLRIKTDSNLEKIILALNSLIEENLVKEFKIVPYLRESYRYGGIEFIDKAEKCFEIDSLIVSKYYEEFSAQDEDFKIKFAIDNIINILSNFGYDSKNYNEVFKYIVTKVQNKNYYRKNKDRFIDSIKYNNKYMNSYSIDNLRESSYLPYVNDLKSNQEINIHKVVMSIIHMFCNRLFGTDRDKESFVLEMLSRSYKDYINIMKYGGEK